MVACLAAVVCSGCSSGRSGVHPLAPTLQAQVNTPSQTAAAKPDQNGFRTLSGVVTNEQGEPMVGAYVIVKGTKRSAMTNVDG